MKKNLKNKIKKHLKGDIKMYKDEANEDRALIKTLKGKVAKNKKSSKSRKKLVKLGRKEKKIADVMEEYKEGKLRSGSKKGPKVKSKKQAIAIALSEAKKKK